jgi:nitrogen-specific signal transduction histidine kinase
MKYFKELIVSPKSLVLIFVVSAIIVISSFLIEFHQSKKEMLELMTKQSHTLLETILASSNNVLLSFERSNNSLKERLLNNASMIRILLEQDDISNNLLNQIATNNSIYRISIFNNKGNKLYSSHNQIKDYAKPNEVEEYLKPIFDGIEDTLIIGMRPANQDLGDRFVVAISTKNNGAIVLSVIASDINNYRRDTGFGFLLKSVTENQNLIYAVLQDEDEILAGSGNFAFLESLPNSDFLRNSLEANDFSWRVADYDSVQVFEAVHPFIYQDNLIGLFRLGISLEPINIINERVQRRVIFIGGLLLVFGFITISLVFAKQNFRVLADRFRVIEKYSNSIIENVSEAIIVIDSHHQIVKANNAAKIIFNLPDKLEPKLKFSSIFFDKTCSDLLSIKEKLFEIKCIINGEEKTLLVSKSEFITEQNELNSIYLFKDLTELVALQKQIERNERIIATGELASSVAHEIRNPLNSIGTIIQQLKLDFTPTTDVDNYHNLTSIVYKEVKRINETIENFLIYARPLPIKKESFLLADFLKQLDNQYKILFAKKRITFEMDNNFDGFVMWDKMQMKQVFINLIENAYYALEPNGKITLSTKLTEAKYVKLVFSDNGEGIAEENIGKIFNLYFTTKSKGNGIGLSIVHKIISEHGGTINVTSSLGKGTTFILTLPIS